MLKKLITLAIIAICASLLGLTIANADVTYTNAAGVGSIGETFANGVVINSGVAPTTSGLCKVTGASGLTASYTTCPGGGGGSGNLSVSGTPSVGQMAVFASVSAVQGANTLPISGTFATNTLAYSPNGTNISPLTLGTNLSIASGVINATGSGGGVTSLNSLTGAVTLTAGSNITLTPSGSSVSIASSGGGGITSVTSANNNISVAASSTAPVLTLVQAPALQTSTGTVSVAAAAAPGAVGQVLTTTSSGNSATATWQTPATGVVNILATAGIPIGLPAGNGTTGTVGLHWTNTTGAFALTTSVFTTTYSNGIWLYIPVGQFDGTNPTTAGLYFAIMSSTSVGQVWYTPATGAAPATSASQPWNFTYPIPTGGVVANPGIVTGGFTQPTTSTTINGGAGYIAQTSGLLGLVKITTPAGIMGANGFLEADLFGEFTADTNQKNIALGFAGTGNSCIYTNNSGAGLTMVKIRGTMFARGTTSSQICSGSAPDNTSANTANVYSTNLGGVSSMYLSVNAATTPVVDNVIIGGFNLRYINN